MINKNYLTICFFSLLLLVMFCQDGENPSGPSDISDTGKAEEIYGGFIVSLVAPDGETATYTMIQGNFSDGPEPSLMIWEEDDAMGGCRLLKPRIPWCDENCGIDGVCVDGNKCEPYPSPVYAGKITVTGLKTSGQESSFTMDTLRYNYLPPSGVSVSYPPFYEGDEVTFSVGGSSPVPAFTFSTKGIKPLKVYTNTISLIDDQPVLLEWEPPSAGANTTIHVKMDISHHGGTRGIIEYEGTDNGSMEIPAALIKKLKDLGYFGFPTIKITRRATAVNSLTNATLVIESTVTKLVEIPGLINCFGDSEDECPDGKICENFMCK